MDIRYVSDGRTKHVLLVKKGKLTLPKKEDLGKVRTPCVLGSVKGSSVALIKSDILERTLRGVFFVAPEEGHLFNDMYRQLYEPSEVELIHETIGKYADLEVDNFYETYFMTPNGHRVWLDFLEKAYLVSTLRYILVDMYGRVRTADTSEVLNLYQKVFLIPAEGCPTGCILVSEVESFYLRRQAEEGWRFENLFDYESGNIVVRALKKWFYD